MEESWVAAPLWKLTAERAKEEEPGTAPKKAQAMLAAPIPISSWLGSIFWPLFAARPLVIAAASSMPRMAMAMAVPASSGMRCMRLGPKGTPANAGMIAVSDPSSRTMRKGTAVSWLVSVKTLAAIPRSAKPISASGQRGRKRWTTQKMANVTAPMPMAHGRTW